MSLSLRVTAAIATTIDAGRSPTSLGFVWRHAPRRELALRNKDIFDSGKAEFGQRHVALVISVSIETELKA
jgi:hypothetical protein